jgi:hypothetical protein
MSPSQDQQSSLKKSEWLDGSRAARTATWVAIFYLVTTDILGLFSVPWAFPQLGYGPRNLIAHHRWHPLGIRWLGALENVHAN